MRARVASDREGVQRFELSLLPLLAAFLCGASNADKLAILCPQLGTERLASLSARLQADLAVREAAGSLLVTCDDRTVWTLWVPASGAALAQQSPVAADEAVTEERVLEATDKLFSAIAPSPAPPTSEPTRDPSAEEPQVPDQVREPRTSERRAPTPLGVELGAEGERWSSELTGAFAVHANVFADVFPRVMLSAGGEAGWALGPPKGLSGRTLGVQVHGDAYLFGRNLLLGAGLSATSLVVHSSDGLEDADWAFAFELRARAAQSVGPWRAFVGPFVRIRPGPTVVVRSGVDAFEIPTLTAGLALDVGLELFGHR